MPIKTIHISDRLRKILYQFEKNSLVAKLLLSPHHDVDNLVDKYVDYISISSSDITKVSYLPHDRIRKVCDEDGDFWGSSMRFQAKPGSFINKLFKNIPAKEIEIFSTLYRNITNMPDFIFKIVEGEEIKKWYKHDSYTENSGSLGASCMKAPVCQDFLNIYTKNIDVVKMIIMVGRDQMLIGRALLWEQNGIKVMDRIYTISDEEYQYHFKKWADENGFLYKKEQRWNNTLHFESNGETVISKISFQLKNHNFELYPYVDTFKFLDNNGVVYNYKPENSFKTICAPDGRTLPHDYLAIDVITNLYHHLGEIVYLSYKDNISVFVQNTCYSEINERHIHLNDSIYLEEIGEYIFNKEFDHLNDIQKIEEKRKWIEKRNEERNKRNTLKNINTSQWTVMADILPFIDSIEP